MSAMSASIGIADPRTAPLWRKLLAVRVLVAAIASMWFTIELIELMDKHSVVTLPKWLTKTLAYLAVIPVLLVSVALKDGLLDLFIHLVPDSGLKRALLRGERTPAEITKAFEETGYFFALMPGYFLAAIVGLLIVLLLIIGGFALTGALFSALFAGWPPWAIVICFLLLALLSKK